MSQSEQHGAKEKLIDKEKMSQIDAELGRLNDEYEKKYGFRFVIFKGEKSKEEVLPILKQRLESGDKMKEMDTGEMKIDDSKFEIFHFKFFSKITLVLYI